MPVRFPPGAIASRAKPGASRWREFLFVFHQLLQAIHPSFPLRQLIENWTQIAAQLADSPRERKTQAQNFKAIKAKTS